MKKTYSKPQIMFDSFELSQSIAINCSIITDTVEMVCAYVDEESGWKIFSEDLVGVCTQKPQPGSYSTATFGNVCYEVPTGGWNCFSS